MKRFLYYAFTFINRHNPLTIMTSMNILLRNAKQDVQRVKHLVSTGKTYCQTDISVQFHFINNLRSGCKVREYRTTDYTEQGKTRFSLQCILRLYNTRHIFVRRIGRPVPF